MTALAFSCLLLFSRSVVVPPSVYVSPRGNDRWSGALPEPSADGKDGPVATLKGARDAVRRLKKRGPLTRPVYVQIAPGTYFLKEPLVLTPEDSGTTKCKIVYQGLPGKEPRISGGTVIKNWEKVGDVWRAFLPEVKECKWDFFSLWVDGRRRPCARMPNEGYLYTAGKVPAELKADAVPGAGPNTAFRFKPGDIKKWPDLSNALVVVYHSWEVSIHRIARVDTDKNVVVFTGKARWPFERWGPRQRYEIRNVKAAFDRPGEWCLDRRNGYLHYRPLPGEEPGRVEIVAPRLKHLVLLQGRPEENAYVENVEFRNLKLHHTAWPIGPAGHSDAQAAFSVGGALEARGARNCTVFNCELAHLENYGVWIREGSRADRVSYNHIFDLGAGGIRIGEGAIPRAENFAVSHNVVENNFIHDGGNIFHGAVGIWIGQSSHNTLSHNEICDLDYTGISVGWTWGFGRSEAHHNRIEYNHIYDIGRGVMNDMGGIYTLGVSPGTVEEGNRIHDVYSYVFGGWGIYTDEGSSEIRIEGNVVYNTTSGCFHQHYGRDNLLRNNVFAFALEGVIRRSREEPHLSFTFEHNIVVSRGTPLLIQRWENGNYKIDYNLYWDYTDPEPDFYGMTFAEWRSKGRDRHSLVADPLFRDPENFDFRLRRGSPAMRIGFVENRIRTGLQGEKEWETLPKRVLRESYVKPRLEAVTGLPIEDDFEEPSVGERPQRGQVHEEGAGSVRVTEETAFSGRKSLCFRDAPGLRHRFNPHLTYTVRVPKGKVTASFALRFDGGTVFYHEWRDWRSGSYKTGPVFTLDPQGSLSSRGRKLGKVPLGEWVIYTITCDVKARTFDLSAETEKGRKIVEVRGLKCDPFFRRLTWIGFVADGDKEAEFYLDRLHVYKP